MSSRNCFPVSGKSTMLDRPCWPPALPRVAYHVANFFLCCPDLFDSLIAQLGVYDTQGIYGGIWIR